MVREISAGGVVIRKRNEEWWIAAIEPAGQSGADAVETSGAEQAAARQSKTSRRKPKAVLALPKGLVDPNEKPLATALREVAEETGVSADPVAKLADIKYVYTRAWGDGQRVFKIVSFYLMLYRSGRVDDITAEMRTEVARALWVRLEDAPARLAYKGEKEMARRALEYVQAHPEL